jgi:hypothetical protein
MLTTRREFIARVAGTIGVAGIIMVVPNSAYACLGGTWVVRCPNGHDDTVRGGTCQHVCENEKCRLQVFDGNVVTVVCPVGHGNRVDTGDGIGSFKCRTDGRECRLDLQSSLGGGGNTEHKCPKC